MCPRKSILSAYFDGELGSREHKRVNLHLENCAGCRSEIEGFLDLHKKLQNEFMPKISLRLEDFRRYAIRSRFPRPKIRGQISIPVPMAVAASVLLIAATVLNFLPRPAALQTIQITESPEIIKALDSQESNVISVAVSSRELETILELMEKEISQSGQLSIEFLQLPGNMPLMRKGEPQFLREAIYRSRP